MTDIRKEHLKKELEECFDVIECVFHKKFGAIEDRNQHVELFAQAIQLMQVNEMRSQTLAIRGMK